jgi:N-acetylmuramoyl-L-alanine amidase
VNCRVLGLVVVAFVGLALPARGAGNERSATLKGYRIGDELYVSVNDLAAYYNLGRDKSAAFELADYRTATASLSVQAERRDIELNGINHWLTAPIVSARGRLWMAKTDVLKTIDPVLCPYRLRGKLSIRTIVIDPGHGGGEHGTHGIVSGRTEKSLTLDLANRLKPLLVATGLRVVLTRTDDDALSLVERVEFARKKGADLFVSIHLNSGGSATGIETYCLPPGGAASTATPSSRGGESSLAGNRFDEHNVWLAHNVQRALTSATGTADRGVRRARFVVLRDVTCPAILIEGGFLSNPSEEKRLLDPVYRDRLAKAMASGILAYRSSVEVCTETAQKPANNSPRR